MQSRMDKYSDKKTNTFERTRKNTKLYEDVYEDIYKDASYKNMEVIDSAKAININKLKNMLDNKYDTRQYRTLKKYELDDDDYFEKAPSFDENKSYDINEILTKAKEKRSFIDEAKEKRKIYDYNDELTNLEYKKLAKEESELEDLINTMAINKVDIDTSDELDLLSDLKGEENTIVTNPIDVSFDSENINVDEEKNDDKTEDDLEKTLLKADKNFYTDSNMFTKNDFEDFSTLTRKLGSKSKKRKITIIIFIILVLLLCAFLIYTNFIA